MQPYQEEFVRFLVAQGALRFGEFTLKSGRRSPYFVNLGGFSNGTAMRRLGAFFAKRIHHAFPQGFDLLFGPAYKGVPLAVATAVAFDTEFGSTVDYCFNRKEAKGHGDKGLFVGRAPTDSDRVIILDDVFTTGGTKEEAVELLRQTGASPSGVVIAVDRGETRADGTSAIAGFTEATGLPVFSIISVLDIVEALHGREIDGRVVLDDATRDAMEAYLSEFGAPGFKS